jgi:ABC-type Co2+ transport system permease subunit
MNIARRLTYRGKYGKIRKLFDNGRLQDIGLASRGADYYVMTVVTDTHDYYFYLTIQELETIKEALSYHVDPSSSPVTTSGTRH